jgi:hypothetical protein
VRFAATTLQKRTSRLSNTRLLSGIGIINGFDLVVEIIVCTASGVNSAQWVFRDDSDSRFERSKSMLHSLSLPTRDHPIRLPSCRHRFAYCKCQFRRAIRFDPFTLPVNISAITVP